MPWIQMKLRDATIFVRCDEAGRPAADGGRVEIRYKANDGRAYRASVANLSAAPGATVLPDEHCGEAAPVDAKKAATKKAATKKAGKSSSTKPNATPPAHEAGAVIVYADGACSGNPGPAGSGVVVLDGDERRELSEFLGRGTNNIAELTAILRAAEHLAGRPDPVRIYTDSKYSIGVLTQGWKAKANSELIATTKQALSALPDVKLYYVPGHAGVDLNERADQLARDAVEARGSRGWSPAR